MFCWKGSNIFQYLGIGNLFATNEKIAGHWISTLPRGCMEIKNRHFLSQLLSVPFFSGCFFLQLRFRVEARTLSWELTYPRVIPRHFWVDDFPYPVWWNMLDLPPTQDASHHQDLYIFFSRESRTKPSFVTCCQWGGDPRDMLVSWKVSVIKTPFSGWGILLPHYIGIVKKPFKRIPIDQPVMECNKGFDCCLT